MKHTSKRSAATPRPKGQIEWFSGSSALETPTISISRDGRLRFNAALLRDRKLQAAGGLQLGYDPRGPRVLFRVTKTAGGSSLKLRAHDGGKVAHAKAFFTQHGIDLRKCAGRYTPTLVGGTAAGSTFAIQLKRQS
jgi:hypothetical protein